jgi:putative peptide zinc metalloprotease protein
MNPWINDQSPLPQIRKDLKLYAGPNEIDGSHTYNLFDPIVGRYYKLNWAGLLIIKNLKPGMTISQLRATLENQSTVKTTNEEINLFFEDAMANNLLEIQKPSEYLLKISQGTKKNSFLALFYHYLYTRVPILYPDKFLEKTLPFVKALVSWPAIILYMTLSLVGIVHLLSRFDEFLHTFTYFFNFQGFILYGFTVICIKIIHEFSHAYVAKYYDVHVPRMGVAFILLWPVLYTDVTDSWKLSHRTQRMAISAAGVIAELILAGLSTLGWAFTSPGPLQSAFFLVASVTWISTLIVNLNPALRFDGYYLLSDLWGIDNLQARSFALTRWKLREWFLGVKLPAPEANVSSQRLAGMMVYSIFAWLYRLFLYSWIAMLVYSNFTKAVGIILFATTIVTLLIMPLFEELKYLYRIRSAIKINARLILTLLALTLVIGWISIPFSHSYSFPGITASLHNQIIYAPVSSQVIGIYAEKGDKVKQDQLLIRLTSQTLDTQIRDKAIEKEILSKQIQILSQSDIGTPLIPEQIAQLASVEAQIDTLQKQRDQLEVRSFIEGTLYEWDEYLKVGQFVIKDQVLGKIANFDAMEVVAFIPEYHAEDATEGQEVFFRLTNSDEKIRGIIRHINPTRTEVLLYPALASIYKGDIPVKEDNRGRLMMIESYYMVFIDLPQNPHHLPIDKTGKLFIESPPRSYLANWIRALRAFFWHESSF